MNTKVAHKNVEKIDKTRIETLEIARRRKNCRYFHKKVDIDLAISVLFANAHATTKRNVSDKNMIELGKQTNWKR